MKEKNTQRYKFYSALLKSIACTRNCATDDSNYQKGVLEPAKAIREMETSSNAEEVGEAESRQALSLLKTIFETKKVSDDECNHLFEYIKEVSGISANHLSEV